jgi:PKD repeat protein
MLLLVLAGSALADLTAVEGQSFTGDVAAIGGCDLGSAAIDWGDGTSASPGSADGDSVQGTHTYAEEGTYHGSVTYTCNQFGGTQTMAFTATVQDAPLSAAGRDSSGDAGRSLSPVVAHVDDSNPGAGAGDFTAQIAWGDGSRTAGTVVAAPGGGFDVTGTHTYSAAGSYGVNATITDIGGATASATSTARISPAALRPPVGPLRPVASFAVSGASRTLKGGLWLNATGSTAQASNRIVDYSWAVAGSPYTPCGSSPIASVTFRRVGRQTVTLRIRDSAGAVAVLSHVVDAQRSEVNSKTPFDCENPAAGGNQPSTADCVKAFAWSITEVGSRGGPTDCFKLDQFLNLKRPPPSLHSQRSARAAALNLPDLYRFHATITGPVAINGLYVPVPKASKTFYDSGDNTVSAGHYGTIDLGPVGTEDLNLDLKVTPQKIPAGGCYSGATSGYHLPINGLLQGDTKIAGLPIGGSLAIDLLYRSSRITATVRLPNIFKLSDDSPVEGTVCLNSDNVHGVSFEGIKISVPSAMLGPVQLQDLSFTYLKTSNVLQGGATVILFPGGPGIDASPPPPDNGFGLKNGRFDHAGLNFIFPIESQPVLYPGVFLTSVGLSIGVDPVRITGQVGVNVVKIVGIEGDAYILFATTHQPYDFPTTSSGPLAPLSGKHFDTFTLAIAGTAALQVPVLGDLALGNGYLLYEYPDYFETGGGLDFHYSFLHISASVGGFVDPPRRAFNFEAKLSACAGTLKISFLGFSKTIDLCISAGGVVSSHGIGVCAPVLPFVNVTIGYVWGDGPKFGLFSCDLGDFEEPNARAADLGGRGRAASTPAVTLPGRLDAATIRLTGASVTPDAVLTTPGGTTFSTAGTTPSKDIVVVHIPGAHETLIGLRHPHAGRWSIAPAPGSAAITSVAVAKSLPAPHIVGHISRHGRHATLRYRLTTAPGRKVTFEERGTATAQMIGTARGNHGSIAFTPGNGPAGRRHIVALISQNGAPVRDVVIATYAAPGPLRVATPKRVRASRRGSALRISWARVPGAAAYATTISFSNGYHEMLYSRHARVTFIGAETALRGRVRVLALGKNGTRSSLGAARFKPPQARRRRRK